MGKVVAFLSYIGIGLLLAITLFNTMPELDVQDWYFAWVVVGMAVAALLTVAFRAERRSFAVSGFSVTDGLVVVCILYLLTNYQLISPVNVSAKWLQTTYFAVLYGAIRMILPAYKQMEKFTVVSIMVCGLWESILGLMQLLGFRASLHHLFSFTGTFFNTGPYGGLLAVCMSIALGFMVKQSQQFNCQCKLMKRFPRTILLNPDFVLYVLCILSFSASFTVFFAAMSRAAIVSFLISAVVVIFTQPVTKRVLSNFFKMNRKIKVGVTLAISVVLLSGVGATYYLKKESANGRVLIWQVSCQVMAKQSLLGSGFGTFFGAYSTGSADYFRERPLSPAIPIADVPEYSFNEYLQTGVETGIVGMTLLLAILFWTLYRLLKAKSLFAYGLIVIMIFAFFSYPFSQLPFQILLVLFIADGAHCRYRRGGREARPSCGKYTGILACVVFIAIAWGLSGMYTEKIEATESWKQIRPIYQTQSYDAARQEYAELYPLLKDNPRFLFEYGHALNKTGRFAQSNAILQEGTKLSADPMFYNVMGNNYKGLGDMERAEESYLYAFDILPNRIYPLYLLMKLYLDTGQPEKASAMAQKVLDFPPKIDSPAVRDMKREAKELLP